jgi:hypothetical protein
VPAEAPPLLGEPDVCHGGGHGSGGGDGKSGGGGGAAHLVVVLIRLCLLKPPLTCLLPFALMPPGNRTADLPRRAILVIRRQRILA